MSIQAFEIAQKAISEMAANAARVEKELAELQRMQALIADSIVRLNERHSEELESIRRELSRLGADAANLREQLLP